MYYTVVNKNRGTHSHVRNEAMARMIFTSAVRKVIPKGVEPYFQESIRRVW